MSARIVIVGEDNPYGGDPRFALFHLPRGASGDRLRVIMGLRDATYEALEKVNLCASKWSATEAREAALALVDRVPDGTVVVILGAKVRAACFEEEKPPFFGVLEGPRGLRMVVLPHPSGRNHAWNEPGAVARARECFKFAAPDVPWGEVDLS